MATIVFGDLSLMVMYMTTNNIFRRLSMFFSSTCMCFLGTFKMHAHSTNTTLSLHRTTPNATHECAKPPFFSHSSRQAPPFYISKQHETKTKM